MLPAITRTVRLRRIPLHPRGPHAIPMALVHPRPHLHHRPVSTVLHRTPSPPALHHHHTRSMSSSAPSCALSAGPELHISAADAQREANVRARVAELTDAKRGARKWVVTADGKGVERVVRFKTFKAAWSFMESVATKCKETRHHPEWTNIYNKTHVVWTTHSPSGLSSKDVTMAEYSDVAAADAGEVEPTEEQRHDDEKLFASKRMEANECCTRKP